ncbi:Uncharacterised protein, partial [Metamycoplasma alkalescens]
MNNFSTTLGDATDASSSTQQNLTLLAQTVQKYINIVLGSMAGLLVLAIMIVGAIAW